MEVTAQLGEFIRIHGPELANLWLERVEPDLEARGRHEARELHGRMQLCFSLLADALNGARQGATEVSPALDPCLALLGYDLLVDALRDVLGELDPAELAATGRPATNLLACAVSDNWVRPDSERQRRALDFVQGRLAQLTLDRRRLERRVTLLSTAFDQLPIGLGVSSATGRILLANPRLERLLGQAPALFLEQCRVVDRSSENGAGGGRAWPLVRAFKEHRSVSHELVELGELDGGAVVVDVSVEPLTTPSEAAALLMVEDVTERRRHVHDLERIWNLARDLLCVVGTDAYFKRVNPAFTRTLGYSEEELLGTSLLEFVHPEDRTGTVLELSKAAQGVPCLRFENRYRCRDDSYKWLAWSATPVAEEGVAYAIARDVSDDHKLRDAQALLTRFGTLVASCLDYESTLANLARVVVPTLADWCLIDILAPDGRLSCVEVASADSTKFGLASRLRSTPPKRPEHPALRAVKSGRLSSIPEMTPDRLRVIANDARHLDALTALGPRSLVSAPLQVQSRVLGALTLIMAESGRRYGPEDLMLIQDLSRRAAQAIDNARLFSEAREHVAFEQRVVAVVSHDLRNPLTAIAMVVTRMLHERLEARHEQQLLLVQRAVQRALGLVSDLLDVARARVSGGIPLRPNAANLAELVRNVVDEARASHPDSQIEIHAEGDVHGTWDPDRMAQVATNLIVNALTYGDSGVAVTVAVRDLGDEVELSVQNFGKSIPLQAHAPLFDPMQRGPHADKSHAGLGLGLFIAKQIVTAHGGTIAVKSSELEGTTFTVRVPRSFRSENQGLDLSEPRPRYAP